MPRLGPQSQSFIASGQRVLIAVADAANRLLVADRLERDGFEIAEPATKSLSDETIVVAGEAEILAGCRPDSRSNGTGRQLLQPEWTIALVSDLDGPAARLAIEAGVADLVLMPDELDGIGRRVTVLQRRRELAGALVGPAQVHDLLASAERQAREFQLLHQVRTAIGVDIALRNIFQSIVEQVAASFGYTHVSVYSLADGFLQLEHQVGYDQVLDRISVELGVAGRVARTGEEILLQDVAADPAFLAAIPGLRSEICVPFFRGGQVAGIFNVESSGDHVLTDDDLRLMVEVTGFLNLAVERARLLGAVQDSEERLRLALEAAGMGTWVWYPQSGDVMWSEQMGPLYGLPPGTPHLSAEEWFSCIHPDDRDRIRRADRQFLRFGEDYEVEFRVILETGAIRWLEGKGRVVQRDDRGEVASIVGVTMDITGRKRLEEERLRLIQMEVERARAEDAQRLITDTLERMSAGFIAVDRDWRITYLNQRALTMLGWSEADLTGSVIWRVFPWIIGTEIEQQLEASARSQEPANFDAPWPGIGRWFEVHAYPAIDGLSIYLQDVTEQRKAEEEHRRTEERFKSLVQHASDIILIIDRTGTVRYASPAVERVIGQTPDEIVGSDNFFRVHPQDAKRLRRAFVRVAKTPGVSPPIVLRFRHKFGGFRWLEVTATNLFDDPAIEGIVANCRDVTERHDAEYNLWFLAETSAMLGTSLDLETTLSSIARLVVMNLADMCIVDVVDEQGGSEAYAVAHRDAVTERRLIQFRAAWPLNRSSPYGPGYVLQTGRSLLYGTIDDEIGQLWLSGSEDQAAIVDFGFRSAIVVPMVARGVVAGILTVASTTPGRFTGVELGLVEELARRSAMAVDNARLYRGSRAAVEARDQFLSVAAHELRTPITAITGFSALLDREMASRNDPVRVNRFVRRLADAGTRLSLLVDDMLDVSRIRLGELPLRIGEVDLRALIDRVVQRYAEQEVAVQLCFEIALPEVPCLVHADEDRLDQVMSNVIDNAIKYSGEGQPIGISLVGDADGYLLRVQDTGIGLPLNDLESIFRPFGRASNAISSNVPGLGIGLFISRNIVERHGGRIWAESEGEGLGTTFAVWLPTIGVTENDLPPQF